MAGTAANFEYRHMGWACALAGRQAVDELKRVIRHWLRSPVLSEFFGKLAPDSVLMREPPVHR